MQEEEEGATNKKKEKNNKNTEGSRSVPIRIVENGGSHFGPRWAL
jgi:hypothetical protein